MQTSHVDLAKPVAQIPQKSVRIVIPAFNAARFLAETLQSVGAQSHNHWRCFVVDDGSVDGTASIVEAVHDRRVELLRQPNAGVSAARNHGMSGAKEDYVLFLDADDILHPTALERLVLRLDGSVRAVASFGTLRKILADGTPYPGQSPPEQGRYPSGDVLKSMLQHNFLANGGQVLVKTRAAQSIGGFDTRLRLSEDWEFWCRLAATGEFTFIDNTPEVFSLRMSDASVTRTAASEWENYLPSFKTVFSNEALQARFSLATWRKIRKRAWAEQRWEFGRVSFTRRAFRVAFRAMGESLLAYAAPKHLALAALAIVSAATGRSLASRLRFADHDAAIAHRS